MCSTVVKSSHVQGGAATNRVRREISISVVYNSIANDTAMSEKVVFQQPSAS